MMLALVAPYLLGCAPARAQRGLISVYVLDFNNKTKVGGALLGRVAAAQTSLQLSESLTWEVVPESLVQRRIQELNIQPPFDRVNRVQIAGGVDATAVVYGDIQEARVTSGANPQAFVRIQVLVEDIRTGVLVNGAIAEGTSTPRMGFTGDADILLEEALGKAAFKAREFMDRFRLPEGTVLNTTVVGTVENPQLDALINIGARGGMRRGMTLMVTRLGEPVGRAKVTSVDSDFSTARVTENQQGVRPEDRIRAIFNFADFPITRSRIRSLAPEGAARLASAEGGDNEPAAQEPDARQGAPEAKPKPGDLRPTRVVRAENGGEFVQLGAAQEGASGSTVQPPPAVVVDEPEVEKGGGAAGRTPLKFLGRNGFKMVAGGLLVLGILAIGGRGGANASRPDSVVAYGFQRQIGEQGAFIRVTWDRPKSIRSSLVLQYVIWRASTLDPQPIIVGALDGDSLRFFIDNESPRPVNAFSGNPGDVAGGRTVLPTQPGLVAGQQYYYQVSTAYNAGLEDRNGDGKPDTGMQFMSPLSMRSAFATAIAPPAITQPQGGEQVQLDQLEIRWQQSLGANEYVIWVSRDPTFPAAKRVAFGPFRTIPSDQGGTTEITRTIDARNNKLGNARIVFIAVGARNALDAIKPKPFGAIFSNPIQVQAENVPPPPPGSTAAALDAKSTVRSKNPRGSVVDVGGKKGNRK
jgi:hypothetical protein